MNEREKMLAGLPYHAGDPELVAQQQAATAWLARYNAALGQPAAVWRLLLGERLGSLGEGSIVRPPRFIATTAGTSGSGAASSSTSIASSSTSRR